MGKQQCVLEDVTDSTFLRPQVDAACGIEQENVVDADRTARRPGDSGDCVDHAALARSGAPEETDDGRFGGELHRKVKCAELLLDINVDHRLAIGRIDA